MAEVFPYEIYALRIGPAPPLFALVSPVRALLVLIGPDAPSLSRDVVDALREIDCAPADVRDIVLLGPQSGDGPKTIAAFADAWIHRPNEPVDLLAGISVVRADDGSLALSVMTRRGRFALPTGEPVPSGKAVRLD